MQEHRIKGDFVRFSCVVRLYKMKDIQNAYVLEK